MTLSIQNLLLAMTDERKKTKPDDDEDFIIVQQNDNQWPKLFDIYFLSPTTRLAQTSTSTTSDDDLIFYVTRKMGNEFQHEPKRIVVAFRHHDVKRQPKLAAPDYDWEETTNLNLVLHQFEYTVITAVCIKKSSKNLQIIKRHSLRVYASPSRHDMENKATEEKLTYPSIYFSVDNFEDTFCEMIVNEGQMICVELVAKNPVLNDSRVLFLGSIKYEALKNVYDARATASTRAAQRMSLGKYTKRRVEFVRMRGPNGKGHAEMAVSQYQCGGTTPESSPTTPTKRNSDEGDWDKRRTIDNGSGAQWAVPTTSQEQQQIASNATTPEGESTDIRQELSDDTGGFLGRTLNQAMNWVRGPSPRLNESIQSLPLQTCLTYLTLPCELIVKDVLESNSKPILTAQ